jgi:hypothetical protein
MLKKRKLMGRVMQEQNICKKMEKSKKWVKSARWVKSKSG